MWIHIKQIFVCKWFANYICNMAYSVRIVLDDRKKKRDGFPLVLRIIANRKSTSIPLGLTLELNEWNESSQTIRSSCDKYSNVTRENKKIKKKSGEAFELLSLLDDSGELNKMSISDIKKRILKENKPTLLSEYTKEIILEMKATGRLGNARAYHEFLQWVIKYNGTADIPLEYVTLLWIKKMEQKFLSAGNSVNGLGVKLRSLRAMINKAISENLLSKDSYPFSQYKIKKQETAKRALPKIALTKIINTTVESNDRLERTRRIFLFSFYMRGASFSDICFLKVSDINNNRIYYNRRKTSKLYSINITEPLERLLEHFTHGKSGEDYILPFLKKEMPLEQAYSISRSALGEYNKDLRDLAKFLEIKADFMSTNTIRHSFASLARDSGVDVSTVSKMLGHSDLKTTQIYLASISDETMDDAFEMVMGNLA